MSRDDIRPFAIGLNLLAYTLAACVLAAGVSGTSLMMNRAIAEKKLGRSGAVRAQGPHRRAPPPAVVGDAALPVRAGTQPRPA